MQKEINKFENERNEIERCLYFLNGNDNLSNEEVAFLEMHITQKKRELVNKTFKEEHPPVSYTHLTLPTKLEV